MTDILYILYKRCICMFHLYVTIGERQETQILKFNSPPPPPPPPTHSVCNSHLVANFLSFHMSLVVVMNCGAGKALQSLEISMF